MYMKKVLKIQNTFGPPLQTILFGTAAIRAVWINSAVSRNLSSIADPLSKVDEQQRGRGDAIDRRHHTRCCEERLKVHAEPWQKSKMYAARALRSLRKSLNASVPIGDPQCP